LQISQEKVMGECCWHWREFLRFLVPKCYADDCLENENLEMWIGMEIEVEVESESGSRK
jgi:hypothetical protein